MADHVVNGAEAQLSHNGTELVRDVIEEVDDMLWRTLKLLSQFWILSGNADRAGIHYQWSV